MSVPKDLANCWTDFVLLHSEAFYRSWEGFKLFWGRVSSPPSPKKYFVYLFKTQILNGMRSTFPPPTLSKVPLDDSRGVVYNTYIAKLSVPIGWNLYFHQILKGIDYFIVRWLSADSKMKTCKINSSVIDFMILFYHMRKSVYCDTWPKNRF